MAYLNELSSHIRVELEKADLVSPVSILLTSESDLCKLANLSQEECRKLRVAATKTVTDVGFVSAFDTRNTSTSWKYLSVGCQVLDKFLRGGIPLRGITEIAGDSSSGKTQLCMQIALTVQYPSLYGGLDSGAVYICTEDAFPSRRLKQLFLTFPPAFEKENKLVNKINFGDNIFIEHTADISTLKQCLIGRLPALLSQKKVGLIVLDSIAGVFRADYDSSDALSRAQELRIIGGQLHKLSREFKLAVICVNQVTCITSDVKSQTVAALGLSWANLVTTRLQLRRSSNMDRASLIPVRTMEVTPVTSLNELKTRIVAAIETNAEEHLERN